MSLEKFTAMLRIIFHQPKKHQLRNAFRIGRRRSEIFKEEVKEMGTKSLAMKITSARIAVINKLKKANASIEILSGEDGVRAEIKLPVVFNF